MNHLLHITDLTVEFFDGGIPHKVVDNLSLTMEEGEIRGIVGESGSGKTMTSLAVAGLLPEDARWTGQILFDGENLADMEEERLLHLRGGDVSMIFQEPMISFNPVMKIGKQVEEELLLHTKLSAEERKKIALETLEDVELDDPERVYNSYPHELSGGMRQRAMIAAAIANRPRLLIADEPTTALDVTVQRQILDLLKKISDKYGMAILFISHDLGVVNRLCEKVTIMQGGKVVEEGVTKEVFRNPKEDYTENLIASIPGHDGKEPEHLPEKKTILKVEHVNSFYTEKKNIFAKPTRRQVLRDVSFELYEGESLGLVGESGCGKTTLSKVILGWIGDKTGNVTHFSEHPQMVFQDPFSSLNPSRKIGWLLQEPLKLQTKLTKEEREQKVAEMLQDVGLSPDYADRYPDELSGGQRQRVSIALSLMLGSKLILADEPVSALDVTVQSQIMELLNRLRKEKGLSYLFISHDLNVIYQMCSRAMVMKEGQIVEMGTVEEIFHHPKHEYTKTLLASVMEI